MPPEPTLYDVLGVGPDADDAVLHHAYVGLARRHHPDVAGGDATAMQAINAAWATLGDPARRADYDRSLRNGAGTEPTAAAPPSAPDRAARDGEVDDLDDPSVYATVRLPRWLSLLPASLFVSAVLLGFLGLVFVSEPLLALALMTVLLSGVLFLAAPFVALFASRRAPVAGRTGPRR